MSVLDGMRLGKLLRAHNEVKYLQAVLKDGRIVQIRYFGADDELLPVRPDRYQKAVINALFISHMPHDMTEGTLWLEVLPGRRQVARALRIPLAAPK